MKVTYLNHMGNDLMVVNTARVSFDKWKDEFTNNDERLLEYLADHHHDSPFFHPQIQLRVEAPIYVARQLYRHEVGASKNEVSRRYVDDEPEFEWPFEWRSRPGARQTKQGSGNPLRTDIQIAADKQVMELEAIIKQTYQSLLDLGVAPEQARTVLPMSLITKWIWTGSLFFFARVCRDRLSSDAQSETREVAMAISEIMKDLFPVCWPLLMRI